MIGTSVKTTMSDLECAVWAAEFTRARSSDSSHAAVGAAIDTADQAMIDLRDAYGSEHGPLTMLALSTLERAVWAAEFARVRAGDSAAVRAAIAAADQAVIDVRDALGTEHSSLAMRELRDDPGAQLAVLRERLLREKEGR